MNAKPEHCHSCAVPLSTPGMEMAGAKAHYCRYCVGDDGEVKSRETVRGYMKDWMMAWQPPMDDAALEKRVDAYMASMPHWAE